MAASRHGDSTNGVMMTGDVRRLWRRWRARADEGCDARRRGHREHPSRRAVGGGDPPSWLRLLAGVPTTRAPETGEPARPAAPWVDPDANPDDDEVRVIRWRQYGKDHLYASTGRQRLGWMDVRTRALYLDVADADREVEAALRTELEALAD